MNYYFNKYNIIIINIIKNYKYLTKSNDILKYILIFNFILINNNKKQLLK